MRHSTLVESDGAEYVAQLKVGSDGMTSNSNYNMKLPDENFADTNIVATDLVDDEIDIDNDFDETEFYFNQVVENFSEQKIQNGLTMIISMNQIMRKRRQLKL